MSERHGIVVGIDGSPGSAAALRWATDHEQRFGPIRPVYVWSIPALAIAGTPLGYAPAPPVAEMEAAAERAAAALAEAYGLEPADMAVVQGDAGAALCDAAEDANVLVVGTRSRGPVRTNLLGSVGRFCADHASVPLVIVPPDDEREGSPEPVVVGVDGSPNSIEALRWATAHAGDAPVTAVACWQTPVDGPILFGGGRFDLKALRAQAETIADEAIGKVAADLGVEPDRIGRRIAEGDPRWILQGEQPRSSLLVLGRRGRGGLAHLVLGSTTTALIRQPDCPIAVIPPEDTHE
ncbi:MAG: universal stress protein [Actinomycetota bacterium]